MLTFLTITFWVLVLLAAPVAFVRLILALRGKRIGETPYCKRCHYNRNGIHPDSPCPECGCGTCDMYGWPNVVQGKRTRTLKRITFRLMLVVTLVGGAWGMNWLHDTLKYLPITVCLAAGNGEHDKVRRLVYWFPELADGKIRFARYEPFPPLFSAVRQDDLVMIDILLKAGADPNGTPEHRNHIPLYEAIQHRSAESCRHLLEGGADPNVRHPWLGTPLLILAITDPFHSIEKIQLLLDHGANVNARSSHGNTPLDRAISRDDNSPSQHTQAVIDLLRAHGAMTSDELDALAESAGESGDGDGDGDGDGE